MTKKEIVKFLKDKRRKVYPKIVEMYQDKIFKTAVTLALELIEEDLTMETGQLVKLNYHSLAKAISRFKVTRLIGPDIHRLSENLDKIKFSDSHKLKATPPGSFVVPSKT